MSHGVRCHMDGLQDFIQKVKFYTIILTLSQATMQHNIMFQLENNIDMNQKFCLEQKKQLIELRRREYEKQKMTLVNQKW